VRFALFVIVFASVAHATAPRGSKRLSADTLTALPAAGVTKPLRVAPNIIATTTPPIAWAKLAQTGKWQASWDAATGVPHQIWGSGIAAPGANADPAIALAAAEQVLADHIGLLAPGASPADFVVASNTTDGDIRSIGFFQYASGVRVEGGQLSFRFKRDRLFVIASQALPYVTVALPRSRRIDLVAHATASLRDQLALPTAPVTATEPDVILALVADDGVLGYRIVSPMTIDGGADGRYRAYVDVGSGAPIAVRQLNSYASGTVLYHGVDRYPGRGRLDLPAQHAHEQVDGSPVTTDVVGALTWPGDSSVTVTTAVVGDLANVVNNSMTGGDPITGSYVLTPSGSFVWDASDVVENDAQVIAYLSVNNAKEFVRANMDPDLSILDTQLLVNVNLDQDCNAYFDGTNLNFFHLTSACENTARIQDVVFHEFGHDVHANEIIPGVGIFDQAMSEGMADFLAASITGDHGIARGFNFTDAPLRDIDPDGFEYKWPQDIGEVHATGLIISGSFWDLRKQLIVELGQDAAVALVAKLYIGAERRSVDIPSTLIEVLATDDDDGDLSNGTPHECEIRDNWATHGLRTLAGGTETPGTLLQAASATDVAISLSGLSTRCNSDTIDHVLLSWSAIYERLTGSTPATPTISGYAGQIALEPHNVMSYRFDVTFTDGTTFTLPDNRADPAYEIYNGPTVPLYCTDFESVDPFTQGWTAGDRVDTPDLWQWGTPTGGGGDPAAAFSGAKVLALGLDTEYLPSDYAWLKSPVVPVGQYSDVRLQYRRWLGVEDGFYDQARITVNDAPVWQNVNSNQSTSSTVDHVDKEWRFQDVQLAQYYVGHTVQIGWDLTSDSGLEFGGWTLDDVCIVANPESICGDGIVSPTEECDNGIANADVADTCRTYCRRPRCGDMIVDTGEQCDDGAAGSPSCTSRCETIANDASGCATTPNPSWLALVLVGLFASGSRCRRPSRRRCDP
jgi:hypothetical protein